MTQILVDILSLAAVYALYASGLTMVFGILEVLNGAQSAVFGITAVATMVLVTVWHLPLWASCVVSVMLASLLNLIVDRMAFRPLRHRKGNVWGSSSHMIPLMTSLAAASIMAGVANRFGGLNSRFLPPSQAVTGFLTIGGTEVQVIAIAEIATSFFAMIGLHILISRTHWGREVRALADRLDTPQLLGINPERRIIQLMVLSGALAGVAAIFWSLTYNIVSTASGDTINVLGFVLIVVGGLGSIPGSILGALVIAAVQVLDARYWNSGFQTMLVDGGLFALLALRPQGFFGRAEIKGAR